MSQIWTKQAKFSTLSKISWASECQVDYLTPTEIKAILLLKNASKISKIPSYGKLLKWVSCVSVRFVL